MRLGFISYWPMVACWVSGVGVDGFESTKFKCSVEWFVALASDLLGCLEVDQLKVPVKGSRSAYAGHCCVIIERFSCGYDGF